MQRVELALARGDGHFLGAQFRLGLLQAGLQLRLFAEQRALAPADFGDAFLQCGRRACNSAIWFLRPENGCGAPCRNLAVQITAGENAVAVEQFALGRDKIKRAAGLVPAPRWPRPDRGRSMFDPASRCSNGWTDGSASITLAAPTARARTAAAASLSAGLPGAAAKLQRGHAGPAGFVDTQVVQNLARRLRLLCQDELQMVAQGGFNRHDVLVRHADFIGQRTEDIGRRLEGGKAPVPKPSCSACNCSSTLRRERFSACCRNSSSNCCVVSFKLLLNLAQTLLPLLHGAAMALRV